LKTKLFTKSHDQSILEKIDKEGGQFTAQEHAFAIQQEFGRIFVDRTTLVREYLSQNYEKLGALGFLIEIINQYSYKWIISLGAGHCVLEYILSWAIPLNGKVVAADFDTFMVEKSQELFPEIITIEYDFFNHDPQRLIDSIGFVPEIAIFFGSAYVMDDDCFIKQLKGLKQVGIDMIIDFHAGCISVNQMFRQIIKERIRSILGEKKINKALRIIRPAVSTYKGKFHGWGRTKGELRRLYSQSGWVTISEQKVGQYEYVAILKAL